MGVPKVKLTWKDVFTAMGMGFILLLIVIVGGFYFFAIRPIEKGFKKIFPRKEAESNIIRSQ